MTKKRFFLGMLVFGLTLIGCENDTTNVTDKTALTAAISNAESALTAAVVNEAAAPSAVWDTVTAYISTSGKAAYQAAVDIAKTVNDNTAATQTEVDNAVSILSTAIAGKIKVGTKVGAIGDTGPAGGKIFYVDANDACPGWKYLEAALADISGTKTWVSIAYQSTDISGTATAIGCGAANTRTILTTDADAPAARACADYEYGDYDDWFLPSKDELNEVYTNKTAIGIESGYYWSSSQLDACGSWDQNFSNGDQSVYSKDYTYSVRAVRAF
jgi:hypothetical protein